MRFTASHCSRRALIAAGALLIIRAIPAAAGAPPTVPTANPRVLMTVKGRGTILIELLPAAAPKTVAHFLGLVKSHFYDGILFHRVLADFVAQAGDPKSKTVDGSKLRDISDGQVSAQYGLGMGGSGKTVSLEAKLPHERGTLGLARSQDPDSGDSQFFFNLKANHSLDGGYCVFGKVVDGIKVMDAIKQGDKIQSMTVWTKAKKK